MSLIPKTQRFFTSFLVQAILNPDVPTTWVIRNRTLTRLNHSPNPAKGPVRKILVTNTRKSLARTDSRKNQNESPVNGAYSRQAPTTPGFRFAVQLGFLKTKDRESYRWSRSSWGPFRDLVKLEYGVSDEKVVTLLKS